MSIDLNDRRLASLIVDMVDRRVEQKLRAVLTTTRYGVVVGDPDVEKRTVAVKLLGLDEASSGFVYREVAPEDGDFVRVVIDPRGDRYVDAILGRDVIPDVSGYAPLAGVAGDFSIGGLLSVVGAIAGIRPVVQVYTSVGATSWNVPAGLSHAIVEVVGGGGGGGGVTASATAGHLSGGASGGGGGYARKLFTAADLSGASSFTVTVGGGGTGGTGAAGGTGGTSSFAGTGITTVQATGGSGGGRGPDRTADIVEGQAPGGTGSGGDINVKGSASSSTVCIVTPHTGSGGSSVFGGGAEGVRPGSAGTALAGNAGGAYGGGGSGSATRESSSNVKGGDGAPGVVIVTEFYGP